MHDSPSLRAALRATALDLFGPSDECVRRVARDGSGYRETLPGWVQSSLDEEPYRTRIDLLRECLEWERSESGDNVDPSLRVSDASLPKQVEAVRPPKAGEMRWVTGVDLNDPTSASRNTNPLLVLLDAPRVAADPEAESSVIGWTAWAVSRFVEFAGWWDVITQGDAVPESCAMVQAWNRVTVAEQHLGGCVHTLTPSELQCIRAVWDEYLSDRQPLAAGWPDKAVGFVCSRPTLGGLDVVTGTPSAGPQDPRGVFEEMTLRAADVVTDACRAAMTASVGLGVAASGMRRLLRLLDVSFIKPAAPSGLAVSSAMSDAAPARTESPVFSLDWTQGDSAWRMHGWKGGKVTLERIEGPDLEPSSISWSAAGGDAEHYRLSRDGDRYMVDISAAKAMRRAEGIDRARGEMEHVAAMLPVVHW